MTRYEILTVLYSLEELLKIEDKKVANEKALNVVTRVLKEAEANSKANSKTNTK
jgi:hypothetical protein